MKNPIPSDVWEAKKELIAKLYKDEEWPLKQVIKQIRTEDFDPSETQLRSRLKKWRVTKPSRQTRKKAQHSEQETCGDAEQTSPKQKEEKKEVSTANPGWHIVNGLYSPQDHYLPTAAPFKKEDTAKLCLPEAQRQPQSKDSPNGEENPGGPHDIQEFTNAITDPNSYDELYSSPAVGNVLMNNVTPAMIPTYPNTTYPISPVSRLQSPLPTATTACPVRWPVVSDHGNFGVSSSMIPVPQWYSVTSDPTSQPLPMPYYAITPTQHSTTCYEEYVQSGLPQTPGSMYSPQSPEYACLWREDTDEAKPWEEAKSTYHDLLDLEGGDFRVEHQERLLRIHGNERQAEKPTSGTMMFNGCLWNHGAFPLV